LHISHSSHLNKPLAVGQAQLKSHAFADDKHLSNGYFSFQETTDKSPEMPFFQGSKLISGESFFVG
jgi:hypothetical protein